VYLLLSILPLKILSSNPALKKAFQYTVASILFTLLLSFAGYLLTSKLEIAITPGYIFLLSFCFFAANVTSMTVFFIGQTKEKQSQAFFTLVGTSLKFLIELTIALVWFLILKKTEITFLVLFFVLYLSFTVFSMIVILKTLKKNSL
jgi:hypothetical protein